MYYIGPILGTNTHGLTLRDQTKRLSSPSPALQCPRFDGNN